MQRCGRARCSRRGRLLCRLVGRTHVPALALSCPIRPVVPVAPLRCGRIRRSKTIIRACSGGRRGDADARYEKRGDKGNRCERSWDLSRHNPFHHY
jgi:hypothetical protein